jgi:hypothetical protein
MNPAIINYAQSQQQIADQMRLLNENSQNANSEPINASPNPFDSGIQRAISTARDSLGMTEKQQDRALRRSLLNFAANIAQTPKQKGFFNNFGAISRAALPAISEYDNAEAEAEMANNAMAKQIQDYQRGLRAEAFEREKFNNQQQFQQDQLEETKRHHDLLDKFNQAKLEAKNKSAIDSNTNPYGYDDKTLGYVAKLNVDEQKEIHQKNISSKATLEVLKDMKEIIEEERNNGSWGVGGSLSAQAIRAFKKLSGVDKSRQALELMKDPFYQGLKDKFGARITNLDLELFLKTIPDLTQDPEVSIAELQKRMDQEELSNNRRLAAMNIAMSKYKGRVNAYDPLIQKEVDELYPSITKQAENKKVLVRSPNGETKRVPASQVDILTKRGGVIVNE